MLRARIFVIAGADIKEMKDKTFADAYKGDFLGNWARISQIRKPVIAAVSGYAVRTSSLVALFCILISFDKDR